MVLEEKTELERIRYKDTFQKSAIMLSLTIISLFFLFAFRTVTFDCDRQQPGLIDCEASTELFGVTLYTREINEVYWAYLGDAFVLAEDGNAVMIVLQTMSGNVKLRESYSLSPDGLHGQLVDQLNQFIKGDPDQFEDLGTPWRFSTYSWRVFWGIVFAIVGHCIFLSWLSSRKVIISLQSSNHVEIILTIARCGRVVKRKTVQGIERGRIDETTDSDGDPVYTLVFETVEGDMKSPFGSPYFSQKSLVEKINEMRQGKIAPHIERTWADAWPILLIALLFMSHALFVLGREAWRFILY